MVDTPKYTPRYILWPLKFAHYFSFSRQIHARSNIRKRLKYCIPLFDALTGWCAMIFSPETISPELWSWIAYLFDIHNKYVADLSSWPVPLGTKVFNTSVLSLHIVRIGRNIRAIVHHWILKAIPGALFSVPSVNTIPSYSKASLTGSNTDRWTVAPFSNLQSVWGVVFPALAVCLNPQPKEPRAAFSCWIVKGGSFHQAITWYLAVSCPFFTWQEIITSVLVNIT